MHVHGRLRPERGGASERQGARGEREGSLQHAFHDTGKPREVEGIYSHSIVAGGLELTSNTTRETPRTSFVIRPEIFWRRS